MADHALGDDGSSGSVSLTPRDQWAVETMRRQRVIVDEAAAVAEAAQDAVKRCWSWLAVDRQAASYQRYLEPWRNAAAFDRVLPDIEGHRQAMADHRARASEEVGRVDSEARQLARRGLGLRIAVVGKGGVGKTVLSATIARHLARQGRRVLAVDLDTNPGLAFSLGLPPSDAGLPPEVLEEDEGANYGWQLAGHVTPREVVEQAAVVGSDGVHYLSVGKITSVGKEEAKHSVAALVQVLLGFGDLDWDIIADLEAGPTTPFERYHAFASQTLVVVGPTWRSAMTARRLWPMVEAQQPMVVGNRFGEEPDHPGLTAAARVPFDPEVAEAERRGLAPLDACPDAPAVRAIGDLTVRLLAGEGNVTGR